MEFHSKCFLNAHNFRARALFQFGGGAFDINCQGPSTHQNSDKFIVPERSYRILSIWILSLRKTVGADTKQATHKIPMKTDEKCRVQTRFKKILNDFLNRLRFGQNTRLYYWIIYNSFDDSLCHAHPDSLSHCFSAWVIWVGVSHKKKLRLR